MESGVVGLMCELVASLLAKELGLPVPEPAVVEVDPSIAELLPQDDHRLAETIRRSGGLNFATRVVVGGLGTWPVDRAIPGAIRSVAMEIFAFDALTQNADRRFDNPNLLSSNEQVYMIDHDQAFSFLYALNANAPAWNVVGLGFLEQHVFYRGLKGKPADLGRFREALQSLSDAKIDSISEDIPDEWRNEKLPRVISHIKDARDHAEELVEQVTRRLL
jgi:HipA-like kinase